MLVFSGSTLSGISVPCRGSRMSLLTFSSVTQGSIILEWPIYFLYWPLFFLGLKHHQRTLHDKRMRNTHHSKLLCMGEILKVGFTMDWII